MEANSPQRQCSGSVIRIACKLAYFSVIFLSGMPYLCRWGYGLLELRCDLILAPVPPRAALRGWEVRLLSVDGALVLQEHKAQPDGLHCHGCLARRKCCTLYGLSDLIE